MNNLAETATKLLIDKIGNDGTKNNPLIVELKSLVLSRMLDVDAEIAFDFNEDPKKHKDKIINSLKTEISKDPEFEKGIKSILQRLLTQGDSNSSLQINAPFANNQSISSQGNVIIADESSVHVGGIFANKIEAENVVSGIQANSSAAISSKELLEMSKGLLTNKITADEIRGKNVVSGIQLLNSEPKNSEELLLEVRALRDQIVSLETQTGVNKSQAVESLKVAEDELVQDAPNAPKILESLETTAKVLTVGADIAQSAGNLGSQIFKLATIASVLWKIASTFLFSSP